IKKDIDDLKKLLHDTQKRKAGKLHQERVLTAAIASKAALLGERAPPPQAAPDTRSETSAAHTRHDGRRRRERRGDRVYVSGLDAACLNGSDSACALMREQKPDVSRLDLRVGRILDVRKHPDSESLHIQEVELGEPAPRTVVSGLTNHMPPEQKELNPKQRIWERLQPDLCTDAKGVATYKGVAFEVRGKGLCRAPSVSNGEIK
uniref:tRNA-binding domain-containing protein n=1 Tax=Cyprinus carpio TaxID=7962 RepID=A0A8C2EQX2_CYPCA